MTNEQCKTEREILSDAELDLLAKQHGMFRETNRQVDASVYRMSLLLFARSVVDYHEAKLRAQRQGKSIAEEKPEDMQDTVSKAMRQAWQLGQTYWQQADSDSYKQNRKSNETQQKFEALLEDTRSMLAAALTQEPSHENR